MPSTKGIKARYGRKPFMKIAAGNIAVSMNAADGAGKLQNAIHVNSLKVLLSGALRLVPSKFLRAPLKRP